MQNQAAVEALYSATFVEDYLDCVENLPNDLQRHLSRLREFDLKQYSEFIRDLENLVQAFENEKTAAGQKQILAKIQLGLIAAQDIGDDKLATVQALTDLIDDKSRLLKHDAENLDFGNEDDDSNQSSVQTSRPAPASKTTIKKSVNEEKTDKAPPAKRRKKPEKGKDDDDTLSRRPAAGGSRAGGGTSATKKKAAANTKSKNRTKGSSNTGRYDSDNEQDMAPIDIDPDEPTYCVCEQVSYGEMVLCDNDLCPFEWFHFDCVNLQSNPRGKWFCPKCRGDKSTVMKPKAQFLKELEKYNKEREEKLVRQSNAMQNKK